MLPPVHYIRDANPQLGHHDKSEGADKLFEFNRVDHDLLGPRHCTVDQVRSMVEEAAGGDRNYKIV
jgi:hypothetical protein